METLEFYHCLDQLLSRPEAKAQLAWKTVVLITHMTKSVAVMLALRCVVLVFFKLSVAYISPLNLTNL